MVRSVKMTWFQKSKKDPDTESKLPKVFRKSRYCTCTEFLGYSYIGRLLANEVNKGCQMLHETGSLILTVPSCMSTKISSRACIQLDDVFCWSTVTKGKHAVWSSRAGRPHCISKDRWFVALGQDDFKWHGGHYAGPREATGPEAGEAKVADSVVSQTCQLFWQGT